MKITILMGTFPWKPSGGAKVAYEYANLLAQRGHDVSVLHALRLPNWTRPERAPLRRQLKGLVLKCVERVAQPKPRWFALDKRVSCRTVSTYDSHSIRDGDVLLATFWPTAETALALPPEKGAPYYLIQHYESWAGDAERISATWKAPLHKIFVSKWLYKRALAMGISPSELTYIPNGIYHEKFPEKTPASEREDRVAMMYGEAEWKGASDGIAALEKVRRVHPELDAVVFGVWRRPAALPEWMQYRQLPKPKELVDDIYNSASIFLCPSHSEGWGLPSAEAMSSGCALVTASNGGSDDFAHEQKTASVAQPRKPDELAARILHLLLHRKHRLDLAKRGQDGIQTFTWKRSCDRLERLLKGSSSKPRSPFRVRPSRPLLGHLVATAGSLGEG